MTKRKVIYLMVKDALSCPGVFGGDISVSPERHNGVDMYTGEEPGFVTIYFKAKCVGVPYSNIKNIAWDSCEQKPATASSFNHKGGCV